MQSGRRCEGTVVAGGPVMTRMRGDVQSIGMPFAGAAAVAKLKTRGVRSQPEK